MRHLVRRIKNRISVSWKVASTRKVMCEVGRMEQVFINLLMNAAQAIQGPGSISIDMANASLYRIYSAISDSGVGMAPEIRSKIFGPFLHDQTHRSG